MYLTMYVFTFVYKLRKTGKQKKQCLTAEHMPIDVAHMLQKKFYDRAGSKHAN